MVGACCHSDPKGSVSPVSSPSIFFSAAGHMPSQDEEQLSHGLQLPRGKWKRSPGMHTLSVSTPCQQARLIWTKIQSSRLFGSVQATHLGASQDFWLKRGAVFKLCWPNIKCCLPSGLCHKPENVGIMKSMVSWSSKGSQRSYLTFVKMCFMETLPVRGSMGKNGMLSKKLNKYVMFRFS